MGNLISNTSDIRFGFTQTSAHGQVTPKAVLDISLRGSYDSATSVYQITDTITGGADTIDLVGSLIDDLSDPVTFQKVHMLHYRSSSASNDLMTFTNNFAAGSEGPDDVRLKANAYSTFVDESGLAISGGADTITVTGTTGDEYQVIVVGRKPA